MSGLEQAIVDRLRRGACSAEQLLWAMAPADRYAVEDAWNALRRQGAVNGEREWSQLYQASVVTRCFLTRQGAALS